MRDEICTEEEISTLVYSFYDRVRADAILGPIFNTHIADRDHHLKKMVSFWSSLMRGTGTYNAKSMPKQVVLPELSDELLQTWLSFVQHTRNTLTNSNFHEPAQH